MTASLELQEIEKLFDLLLYFEGYKTEAGSPVDSKKITKSNFTKTQIVLQSVAIFSQKGISDTTVQDLLEASAVSRRTFYKYFKDKYDVLENIYRLSINMFSTRFNDRIDESSSLENLVDKTVDGYFSYHTTMGNMIRIMHEESFREGSPLNERRISDRESFVKSFREKASKFGFESENKMVFFTIYWVLEDASMYLLTETDCSDEVLEKNQKEIKKVVRSLLGIT